MAPVLEHRPCAAYVRGRDFEVIARIIDESDLFEPKVIYRAAPDGPYQPLVLEPDSRDPEGTVYHAFLPTADFAGAVDYFIEVFDSQGNGPTRHGRPNAPVRLEPSDAAAPCAQIENAPAVVTAVVAPMPDGPTPTAPSPADAAPAATGSCGGTAAPIYCSPWAWVTLGGVVVAAGAVTAWLLSREDDVPERISVEVTAPGPGSALQGGR